MSKKVTELLHEGRFMTSNIPFLNKVVYILAYNRIKVFAAKGRRNNQSN